MYKYRFFTAIIGLILELFGDILLWKHLRILLYNKSYLEYNMMTSQWEVIRFILSLTKQTVNYIYDIKPF